MGPFNFDRQFYFATDAAGMTLSPAQFASHYRIDPNGVNIYVSIDTKTLHQWNTTGSTLSKETRGVLDGVCVKMETGNATSMWVNLGLEPGEPTKSFQFADSHLDFVAQVASEIRVYQKRAVRAGKSLHVVVRYASEVNDGWTTDQPWGRPFDAREQQVHVRDFHASFARVSHAFKAVMPDAVFTFSAALRSDIVGPDYDFIAGYVPDQGLIDAVSCTWFIDAMDQMDTAIKVLYRYFQDRLPLRKPMGIDELGGSELIGTNPDVYAHNDRVLQPMFEALRPLANGGISFDYVTAYVAGRQYGVDATLAFLR